jgi:SPP1 family predicted phage head-tail adaptor
MKCCDITAGMLREPADIQTQETADIGGGATELSYTTRATVRGKMLPLSGNQVLYANRLDARTKNRFMMRYRSDLTESDRLVIRGRAYNITYIDNVEFRDKWLVVDLDGGVAT